MIDLVPVIIQGGAVGLALVAFGIVWLLVRLTSNHFVHFAELLTKVVEKLDYMTKAIERHNDRHARSD